MPKFFFDGRGTGSLAWKQVRHVIASICLLLAFFPSPASAQTELTSCTEAALRSSILNGGIIQLNCDTNRILLSAPLVIRTDTTLVSTQTALALLITNSSRMFVVNPGVKLTIINMGLFGGRQTLTNANHGDITEGAGGAIYNNGGTVTLIGCTIAAHSAVGFTGGAGRGGNQGQRGEDGGDAAGGAIFNNGGLLVISNCVFEANMAIGGQGGAGGPGNVGAAATAGRGGNGGKGAGGAIFSQNGTVLVSDTLFTNNIAMGAVGGAPGAITSPLAFTSEYGDSGGGYGGAILDDAAYVVINNCTFVDNQATGASGSPGVTGNVNKQGSKGKAGGSAGGGAIMNRGALLMTNCTFTVNEAVAGNGGAGGAGGSGAWGSPGGQGGDGGNATGGAIESNYQVRLINCTFSENAARAGTAGAGGLGTGLEDPGIRGNGGIELGGALFNGNTAELFHVGNTIIANSLTGGNVSGPVTDLGGNISTDTTFLVMSRTTQVGVQPNLRLLANNGGPTPTMAINSNSLAYNRGMFSLCPPTDQRGTNRVAGCDVGAFEFIFVAPGSTNGGNTNTNTNVVATNAVQLVVVATNSNSLTFRWESRPGVYLERATTLGTPMMVTNVTTNLLVPFPGGLIETNIYLTNIFTTNWVPVTNSIMTVGTNSSVTVVGSSADTQFFRLRRP